MPRLCISQWDWRNLSQTVSCVSKSITVTKKGSGMQSQRDLASKSAHPKHAQVMESGWHAARVSTLNGEPHEHTLPAADQTPYKILLYSHDTFGLGNIRRTLLLTQDL